MLYCGPNDGGVKRGDRADTGGEEARPTQNDTGATPEDLEDLTVVDEDDPSLGLTDIGSVPADDLAANTGESSTTFPEDRLEWGAWDSEELRGRTQKRLPPQPIEKK